ncbi:hypothetical protein MJO28_008629 [Puccinia striiformis f. sp. tritici]|uniref:Uncharacterized protein n=2 Tax=Puccinia striiformis TaxID=27350 RepID=A0A2S4VMY2_9BASI|nr:hypothetical protein MJO28_008629 [Puccinia striiformis f. sp. tritici]KAI7952881.1 hypothetical protein MJO29_008512 [Puccinia striiformis f. sp. tritici]POW10740.1 hypothetical protein PSHT_08645 [Puccinia striiformis]
MRKILADCVEQTKNMFEGDEMYSVYAVQQERLDERTKETVVTQLTETCSETMKVLSNWAFPFFDLITCGTDEMD